MKFVLIFCCLVGSTLASSFFVNNDVDVDSNKIKELLKEEVLKYVKYELPKLDLATDKDVVVSADIDDFTDKIVINVRNLIAKLGFDNITLPSQIDIKPVLLTHLNLTEGTLSGISSMQRYEHSTISYDKTLRKVEFSMILRITELDFIFKYQSQVLFVHSTGHLHGTIMKTKLRVKLGYDFENHKVFVDDIDINETGTIKIWLSGNSGIDWFTNTIMTIVTGILHPVILGVVTGVMQSPINSVVETINEIIAQIIKQ